MAENQIDRLPSDRLFSVLFSGQSCRNPGKPLWRFAPEWRHAHCGQRYSLAEKKSSILTDLHQRGIFKDIIRYYVRFHGKCNDFSKDLMTWDIPTSSRACSSTLIMVTFVKLMSPEIAFSSLSSRWQCCITSV